MNQPSNKELEAAEDAMYGTTVAEPVVDSVYHAINRIMKKVGYVQKTGRNKFQNYSYASEADLLNAVRPLIVEEGLVISQVDKIVEWDSYGNSHLSVLWHIYHIPSGTSIETWSHGSGNDMSKDGKKVGDKGIYKAQTGASKYMIMKLFMLPTGDDAEATESADSTPTIVPTKVDWTEWYKEVTDSIAACGSVDGLVKVVNNNSQYWSHLSTSEDKKLQKIASDYQKVLKARKEELSQ